MVFLGIILGKAIMRGCKHISNNWGSRFWKQRLWWMVWLRLKNIDLGRILPWKVSLILWRWSDYWIFKILICLKLTFFFFLLKKILSLAIFVNIFHLCKIPKKENKVIHNLTSLTSFVFSIFVLLLILKDLFDGVVVDWVCLLHV